MPKGVKGPGTNLGGRPKIEFDDKTWQLIDQLCMIQCTTEEILSFIGCSIDTFDRRVKEKFGITCAAYVKQKAEGGKTSLRRKQWVLADKSAAMAIWLGKQYLGQREPDALQSNDDDAGSDGLYEAIAEAVKRGREQDAEI